MRKSNEQILSVQTEQTRLMRNPYYVFGLLSFSVLIAVFVRGACCFTVVFASPVLLFVSTIMACKFSRAFASLVVVLG